jgi:putative glutamine amidotransferase
MHRPSIALNTDIMEDDKGPFFFLRTGYARALRKAGGSPCLLAPIEDPDRDDPLEGFGGLVLIGGDDLSPALYGGNERHEEEVPLHPQRESYDMMLVKAAVRKKIPTLAICLGLQELCVAFGGGIHPFIPDAVPGALEHRSTNKKRSSHPLEIESTSRLAGIMRNGTVVNSAHRQAVSEPGQGMRVAARAPDGIIEAVEGEGEAFLLGVQWHPELMLDEPEQIGLFEALVEAARSFETRGAKFGF